MNENEERKTFMLKKISLIILMLIYLISPFGSLEVYAKQSRIDYFNKTYTLTGDPIHDIIAVALEQKDKTGSQLGYTEDWCADFVSDCAILAGVAYAIPAHGNVTGLYDNVLTGIQYQAIGIMLKLYMKFPGRL